MNWFMRQRQDFIRAQLEAFGQIRRSEIARQFEVMVQQASADIATFVEENTGLIDYDIRAKCYVLDREALAPKAPSP